MNFHVKCMLVIKINGWSYGLAIIAVGGTGVGDLISQGLSSIYYIINLGWGSKSTKEKTTIWICLLSYQSLRGSGRGMGTSPKNRM